MYFHTCQDFINIQNPTPQTHYYTKLSDEGSSCVLYKNLSHNLSLWKPNTDLTAPACARLCLSAPWEVIDPQGPFTLTTDRRFGNNKDFCSSLTAWPLAFPSRRSTNPGAVNLTEQDQMKHDDMMTSLIHDDKMGKSFSHFFFFSSLH